MVLCTGKVSAGSGSARPLRFVLPAFSPLPHSPSCALIFAAGVFTEEQNRFGNNERRRIAVRPVQLIRGENRGNVMVPRE